MNPPGAEYGPSPAQWIRDPPYAEYQEKTDPRDPRLRPGVVSEDLIS